MSGLPVLSGPVDTLRSGFRNLEHELKAPHPVASLEKSSREFEWESKLDMVRRTYGSAMAMRLATEKAVCSRHQRLPGLQFSNINLDTVLGTDTKIEFADFLNGEPSFPTDEARCRFFTDPPPLTPSPSPHHSPANATRGHHRGPAHCVRGAAQNCLKK